MRRILTTIDWQLHHPEIREADFFEGASFSSVDALLIDPGRISDHWTYGMPVEQDGARRTYVDNDRGFGRIIARLFEKRRTEAGDLLFKTGGVIVCRLRSRGETLEIVSQGGITERIDRYSWLPSVTLVDKQHQLAFPSNGRFVPRRGEDVILEQTGAPFEDYLRQFEGKISYDAVYQDILSTPIERFAAVLARNRAGDVVAAQIPYGEGLLVLLPCIDGVSPATEALALYNAVSRAQLRPGFFSSPDWLSSYSLKGEDALRDEIASLRDRRETLSEKLTEVSSQLEEVTFCKRLLYTSGRLSLLPAMSSAFRSIGFSVEEERDEIILRSDEGDAIAGIAATDDSSVGVSAYRRLLDRVDRARTSGDGPNKGILVVSGSRELDPKRRPTQFTPEVLRGCKSQGFCLITTYELFKLVQRALEHPATKELSHMRKVIVECDGEFRGVS